MCACLPSSPCNYHNSKLWSQDRRDSWNAYQRSRYRKRKAAAAGQAGGESATATVAATPDAVASPEAFDLEALKASWNAKAPETPLPWENPDHAAEFESEDFEDVREFGGYAYYKEGEQLFHGSPVDLEVGTIIVPETRTGFAYASPDLSVAEAFSRPMSNKWGATLADGTKVVADTGKRYIYEVRPLEPEKTFHSKFGKQGKYNSTGTTFAMGADGELVGGSDEVETISPSGFIVVGKREID